MTNIVKLNYTADEINERLGKVVDIVQTTGDSESAVMSQKITTAELNAIKSGNINDHSLTAEKVAWLDEIVGGTEEVATELFTGLCDGVVMSDGTINPNSSYKRTEYIDITDADSVQVKIHAFTSATEGEERSLWIARFDKDMNYIENSREVVWMVPLTESGDIDNEAVENLLATPTTNMQTINTNNVYAHGMGKEISVTDYEDGTTYIILTNFHTNDTVDMSVKGIRQITEVSYAIPENMLPSSLLSEIEDLKNNQKQDIADGAVTEEKLADGAVTEEKVAWLVSSETSTTQETEIAVLWVDGYVNTDGSLDARNAYKRTDYLPIADYNKVAIRITSFTNDGSARSLWAARYDNEKNLISDSRGAFALKPLNADGTVNTEYPLSSSGLEKINTDSNYFNGMGVDISTNDYGDNTAYIVFFNLRTQDELAMNVTGDMVKETTQYTIPTKMLPECIEAKELAQEAIMLADEAKELAQTSSSTDGIQLSDYVEPLIDDIALAAKAHMKEDSLCIVLFADTHYTANETCFPTLIAKKLAQATNASAIVHLGDLAHLHTEDRTVGLEIFQKHSNILHGTKIPYLQVVGNHDDGQMYLHNYTNDYSAENYIKAYEMYHATTKQSRQFIKLGSTKGWYYMDDEDSKTRLIVLNAHDYPWVVNEDGTLAYDSNAASSISAIYSTEQIEWLANTALNFADKGDVTEQAKWSVLAFAHMGTENWAPINYLFTTFWAGQKKTDFSSCGEDKFNLYDYKNITITNDFSLVGRRKIAFLTGDIHLDKVSGGNYPLITFLDCKLKVADLGTPNEAAISVLVVTPSEGKITELRFGKGTKIVEEETVAHNPLTDYDNYRVIEF